MTDYKCKRCRDIGKFYVVTAGGDEVLMDCKCRGTAIAYATPCDPAFNNWVEEAEWLRGEVARLNARVAQADKTIFDTNELEALYDKLNRDYCLVLNSRKELIKDYAEWMSPEDYVPLAQERDRLQAEVARLKDAVEGERRMKQVYRDRVEELEAEVARLETIMKDWQDNEDGSNYDFQIQRLLLEQTVQERDEAYRTATEAALRWAIKNNVYFDAMRSDEEWVLHGLAALLGEGE